MATVNQKILNALDIYDEVKNEQLDQTYQKQESGKTLTTNDYTTAEKTKLAGIAENANNYSLPTASSSVLGGVKTGSNITNTSGTISLTKANVTAALGYTPPETNTTYSTGTKTTAGITKLYDATGTATDGTMTQNAINTALAGKVSTATGKTLTTNDYTTAEKTKLAGIATGAEVNAISSITVTNVGNASIASKVATLPQYYKPIIMDDCQKHWFSVRTAPVVDTAFAPFDKSLRFGRGGIICKDFLHALTDVGFTVRFFVTLNNYALSNLSNTLTLFELREIRAGNTVFALCVNNSTGKFYILATKRLAHHPASASAESNVTVVNGTTYFIALTYLNGVWTLYIDGESKATFNFNVDGDLFVADWQCVHAQTVHPYVYLAEMWISYGQQAVTEPTAKFSVGYGTFSLIHPV